MNVRYFINGQEYEVPSYNAPSIPLYTIQPAQDMYTGMLDLWLALKEENEQLRKELAELKATVK